jgi:hypothetical protein
VDEGWGCKAADFATLSEPANCPGVLALHHMLGIDNGDRLLDMACGAGLAIGLASVRGAECAGIGASPGWSPWRGRIPRPQAGTEYQPLVTRAAHNTVGDRDDDAPHPPRS